MGFQFDDDPDLWDETGELVETTVTQALTVDLGLPSGNRWAICNVGADDPTEVGELFMWGDSTPTDGTWEEGVVRTSKWKWEDGYDYVRMNVRMSKYGGDRPVRLEECDDPAKLGGHYRFSTPTADDWNELVRNCTVAVEGMHVVFTSNANGESVKMPLVKLKHTIWDPTGHHVCPACWLADGSGRHAYARCGAVDKYWDDCKVDALDVYMMEALPTRPVVRVG